jgi:hypothetical protein
MLLKNTLIDTGAKSISARAIRRSHAHHPQQALWERSATGTLQDNMYTTLIDGETFPLSP